MRSGNFRNRAELNELLDKGLSVREKYGGERAWKLLLRHDENKKGDIITLRENVGG